MSGLSSVPPSSTQNSGFIVDAMPKTVLSGLQWTVSALPLALTGRRFYQGARPASIEAGLVVSFLSRTFANFIRNLELANLKGTTALDYFSEYLLGKPAEVLFQSPRGGTMPIVEHSALAIRDGITPSLLIDGLSTQNALSTFNTIKQYAKAPLETWSDAELISKLKVPEGSTLEETKALFTNFLDLKNQRDYQDALLVNSQHAHGLARQNLDDAQMAYNSFKTYLKLAENPAANQGVDLSSARQTIENKMNELLGLINEGAQDTEELVEALQNLKTLNDQLVQFNVSPNLDEARALFAGFKKARETFEGQGPLIEEVEDATAFFNSNANHGNLRKLKEQAEQLMNAQLQVTDQTDEVRETLGKIIKLKEKILKTKTFDEVARSSSTDLPKKYEELAQALKRHKKKFGVSTKDLDGAKITPEEAARAAYKQNALKALDALFFAYRVYDFLKEQKAHNDAVKAAQKLGPTLS